MTDLSIPESPETDNLKQCSKCGEWKPATTEHFHFRKDNNKLRSECRECVSLFNKRYRDTNADEIRESKHRYYHENSGEINARRREKYHANPEKYREEKRRYYYANIDRLRECSRIYARENAEKARERNRQWRLANPDKKRDAAHQWYKANPDKMRAASQRRRALKRQAEGSHTADDIRKQLEGQRYRCWWCNVKLKGNAYEVDHRIPLARGGSNAPENLVISCKTCNRSKGARLPHEWSDRLL